MKNERTESIIDRFLVIGLDSNDIISHINSLKQTKPSTQSYNAKILEEYKSTNIK
jgi:hypothetical protein